MNIIVDTYTNSKILEGQGTITYAIGDGVLSLLPDEVRQTLGHNSVEWSNEQLQKLGGGSTGYTLRLLGIWKAKNMSITRKDGLDVIFIPIK